MTLKTDILFRPFDHKGLSLKNRIVMAPMTRGMSPDGIPTDDVAGYYERRAEGEVGLILSEGTVIDRPASRNMPTIPFFHGEALEAWTKVIDKVHAAGGKMGPQIWHTGATQAGEWEPDVPVESPSGLRGPDMPRGAEMSEADIHATIAAFAQAAKDAKDRGFDVAELHGAHGYLIDEFFWAETNKRTDEWGGDTIEARSRFAVEVVKAVRAAVGPDFPIILRLSQWKEADFTAKLAATPEEMERWLMPLVEAGVDILHCSQRRFWEPEFPEIDGENGLNFAGWAKKITGVPTISVGSVGLSSDFTTAFAGQGAEASALDKLVTRMEAGEFDLIAVGRALLSDPAWAAKVKRGAFSELKGFDASALAELV
ncbi:2,4-dienoyl-CoA reductase-like NADH-dependent reductase (Old Yellow Enzyme family) [Pacificibacter maritimus]|uniref:2,4-dienoyl-CoA reductase-like NADH-dependent reductase (Old Yellow Enzyme family) n=1 Tax=Pacificibacter maritimus TaxID=762213 RepID=A0A3N4UM98_9RHOB|nr:NADH:flavin oxidoreductase [Pacificibacter maritimus]RPE71776.1 2,4-dienoyl-CoA reductase-like NADH-dependent reductase (Old Yellow Enzyme family) [Pacificibacter maritimus]